MDMYRIVLAALVALVASQGALAATTPSPGCGSNPADIVFLLDSSGSVGSSNFEKQLDFVKRFAQAFDIGPRNVQMGVVTFSSSTHNEFNLNTYNNKHDLAQAIQSISYRAGGTHTDEALNYVKINSFTNAAGDRDQVANILIVMTDGQSTNPSDTTTAAESLHNNLNAEVFGIGIGSGVDKAELGRIATDAQHVFTVSNFDALDNIQAALKKTACEINGGWTKWGSYSPCTKSCGGGTHFRERSCANPRPANGGADCVGQAEQTEACNDQPCPTTPKPTTTTTPRTTPIPTTLAAGCNDTEPADIVFILDASGSVGSTNFRKMLDFVNHMVDGFPVSPSETHVAMLTFDSKVYNQFHLNKYTNKADIKNSVSATSYTSGTTHTADAIKYARQTSFSTANGMRSSAAKIAIIITDGQSNSPAATSSEAQQLRAQGVTVFSIGVGSGIKDSELNAMATDPDATHVFRVTDFSSLNNIKASLAKKTCEVKATTMPPTTPAPKPDCAAQADIMFLLDASGSVGSTNFGKVKDFVHDLMNSFDIGPNAVQVGVDTFQTTHKAEFDLNTFSDKAALQAAINKIAYSAGGTYTGEALKFLREHSFAAGQGNRPSVPDVAIVITDGNSNDASLTAAEAKKLRDDGVTVLAIGVGNGISKAELNDIATDPDSTHVYSADNFDALKSLNALLSTKACEVSKPAVNNTATPQCAAQADIVFILDSSGSIGQANYNKMLSFVRDVAAKFDIGQDKVRVGVEIFSDRSFIQFNLNQYGDLASLDNAIANIPYKQGTTNTGQALKDAYSKMFVAANGDRPNIPNIAIVVTDGKSTNRPNTLSEGQKMRNNGIQVFTVGVGSNVDTSELNAIATDPDSAHVLTVQDFSDLQQITASLNTQACQAIPPTGMTLTPMPGTSIKPIVCQDQNANCKAYDIPAICQDYAGWSKDNCQRSCGLCPDSQPTPPPPCVDSIDNCADYAADACTNYKPWALDNCRQFCGFCPDHFRLVVEPGNNQQVLTGYFGACYYNGKGYTQGQTWDDGCDYECTCEDATSGRYSCYNKCPIYYNLPPQCTLVQTSGCCKQPVCDFQGTRLTTNGQNLGNNNGVSVCMYKNTPYYQGQTWQDGCDKTCYCQDADVGLWTCQSLCAHYDDSLPAECTLQKEAGKCCEEPVCTFNKQYGQFTGAGTLSGKGTGVTSPTTPGPCVDLDENCDRYPDTTCTDPQYVEWAQDQCKKFCGYCPSTNPTPGPDEVCIYNGVTYKQGQRWDDGCDLECVCENAAYGYYRCQKKCAEIVNLPLGCTQVKVDGDCCPKIQCTGTSGTFVSSSTNGGSIGGNAAIPTPAPGMTVTSAPGTGFSGQLNGCLYKGTLYAAGRRWDDGCDYSCVCEDASTGQYKCTPKCPTFSNLPPECTMMDNPNDPCCQQPVCTSNTTSTGQNIVLVPTYGQGFTGFGQSNTGGLVPTADPSGFTASGRGCAYKGGVYTQSQTWDDGCAYRCECVDASTGRYRCTDRCPLYTNVPPQCQLQASPTDSCCQVIVCDTNQEITTLPPLFAQTTPVAGASFCKYQGYYHRQGEQWNDGCGLTCRCEDAANHYYQCTDRCPKYDNVPSTCTFVADPKDPQCCRVPQCQGTSGLATSGFTGSFTGYGRPNDMDLTTLTGTGYNNKCLYKGQVYGQGDIWHDGCDYDCECRDAAQGQYTCTERCRRVANVPQGCRFIQDPKDACCQTLYCNATALLGQCKDNIGNCASYGSYVCGENYKDWATQNCAKYCGYCGSGSNPSLVTQSPTGECKDTIPNCAEYDIASVCTDLQYTQWAQSNCPQSCNMCGMTGSGSGMQVTGSGSGSMVTGSGGCQDALSNCNEYSQEACQEPYVSWAQTNCARYCGFCGSGGVISGSGGMVTGFQTLSPGSGAFTGFSGGCVYKGKYYGSGDRWQDGCDYNCTCENGQTGFYRCVDQCPTYNSLPAGCVLKTTPGECCAVPDCTGSGTGGTGTETGTGLGGSQIDTSTGCLYNGTTYQQGQEWKDGCKYKCSCIDGASGQYSCSQLCLNWDLPEQCTLDPPAAGKCCETPNCPSTIQIQYPPDYTAE